MNLFSALSAQISTFGTIENVIALDWLGNIIKWLIEGCNSIGVGIIIFTLILKLITLPFDIISRVSTKKNAIKMEKMRPELEKLQKQYANNKELYQRKMQELYKTNGYSAFSACLPSLLTMIIFIVVIGQFSTYSNYANFGVLCKMAETYSETIENYDEVNGTDLIYEKTVALKDDNGNVIKDDDGNEKTTVEYYINLSEVVKADAEVLAKFGFTETKNDGYNAVYTLGGTTSENIRKLVSEMINLETDKEISEKDKAARALSGYNVGLKNPETPYEKTVHVIYDKDADTYSFANDAFKDGEGNNKTDEKITSELCTAVAEFYAQKYFDSTVREAAREASASVFRNTDLRFLWVKNIWAQDLPWAHPVRATFKEYGFTISSNCFTSCSANCSGKNNTVDSMSEEVYSEITYNLEKEKSEPNGYLILVLLSIGTMLLSQLLMQKVNKTQMELSSVDGADGTAAQSQKMMTWMMPIMFGFFSFMYTASFSIYIVISSVISTGSTLLINFFVEKSFEKKAAKEAEELDLKRLGKAYKHIEEKNKKNKK